VEEEGEAGGCQHGSGVGVAGENAAAAAAQLRVGAREAQQSARAAGQASGSYVLMTLAFASVLFFGGITGTFSNRRIRTGLGCLALVLFLAAVATLLGLRVAPG
jgi:hypothetical protein